MFAPIATRFQTYGVELPEPAKTYQTALLSHPLVDEWLELGAGERDEIPLLEATDDPGRGVLSPSGARTGSRRSSSAASRRDAPIKFGCTSAKSNRLPSSAIRSTTAFRIRAGAVEMSLSAVRLAFSPDPKWQGLEEI